MLHGSDQEVGTDEFDVAGLEARIAAVEPANLAFNGKNAARGALGRRVDYGLQRERIGGAAVWVLPSTPWKPSATAASRLLRQALQPGQIVLVVRRL